MDDRSGIRSGASLIGTTYLSIDARAVDCWSLGEEKYRTDRKIIGTRREEVECVVCVTTDNRRERREKSVESLPWRRNSRAGHILRRKWKPMTYRRDCSIELVDHFPVRSHFSTSIGRRLNELNCKSERREMYCRPVGSRRTVVDLEWRGCSSVFGD